MLDPSGGFAAYPLAACPVVAGLQEHAGIANSSCNADRIQVLEEGLGVLAGRSKFIANLGKRDLAFRPQPFRALWRACDRSPSLRRRPRWTQRSARPWSVSAATISSPAADWQSFRLGGLKGLRMNCASNLSTACLLTLIKADLMRGARQGVFPFLQPALRRSSWETAALNTRGRRPS